jgi:uracil-DNA glycosylase
MNIADYQKRCFKQYKWSINFPESNTYYYGNPINPIVPVETAIGQVMIVGAYPSARYFTVNDVQNVPLFDNDAPFSDETYYDGTRIRKTPSGQELNEATLEQIGLKREQCWITDLVKVFLFNEDHISKYTKLGKTDVEETRSRFMEFGKKSIAWLIEEIDIANPKVIILLGSEVIKSIFKVSEKEAREMMIGDMIQKEITWKTSNVICLPHPKFLMRKISKNPWPLKFQVSIAPKAKKEIAKILG